MMRNGTTGWDRNCLSGSLCRRAGDRLLHGASACAARSRQCLTAAVAEEGQRRSLRSARVGVRPLPRRLVLCLGAKRGGRGEGRE